MINSSDLRIGNLFTSYLPIEGSWIEKQRYKGDIYIVTKDTFQCENFEIFKPIPLTEDILLKWEGVVRSGNEWSLSDEFDIILQESDNKGLWTVANVFVDKYNKSNYLCMGDCFKYLHQLQNLVHSLTQKELTVQL